MKRRVAGLPPVQAEAFNQKVLDRRAETALTVSPKGSTCEICNKTYTTENAYRSHILSKKHKEAEAKAASMPKLEWQDKGLEARDGGSMVEPAAVQGEITTQTLIVDAEATEDEINETIDSKIAAARNRLSVNHCLFCPSIATSLDDNLTHMSVLHSFFVPDAEYLVDLPGLITYLGEKLAVGNVCIFCNGKGREFRSLDAVRKHMLDKSHCKIAYDSDKDMLEISDYYDFSSSYPDAVQRGEEDEDDWEDEAGEGDATVEGDSGTEDDDDLPTSGITFGDSHLELILPSGARIGHRSMKRYYDQTFVSKPSQPADPNSGAALVRRLIADKNSALVPVRGGYGAFGSGAEVMKARNRGEAREAGRHVREFRDMAKREQFKTKVGFIHNSQKHFRDPLLQ